MKYKVKYIISYTTDETEFYNELIENGCSPEGARHIIKRTLRKDLEQIDSRAANVLCVPYEEEYVVEEVND